MADAYQEALATADRIVREAGFDLARVSPFIRTVHLITQVDFEVTTGGVLRWLTNSSGRWAAQTATALSSVGAMHCASIVNEIVNSFPNGVIPADDLLRAKEIQRLLPSHADLWRRLGDDLLEWPDDVDDLLRNYVAEHVNDF